MLRTSHVVLLLCAATLVLPGALAGKDVPGLNLRTVKGRGFTDVLSLEGWAVLKPTLSVVAVVPTGGQSAGVFTLRTSGKAGVYQATTGPGPLDIAIAWPDSDGSRRRAPKAGLVFSLSRATFSASLEFTATVLSGNGKVKGAASPVAPMLSASGSSAHLVAAATSRQALAVVSYDAGTLAATRAAVRAFETDLRGALVGGPHDLQIPGDPTKVVVQVHDVTPVDDGWLVAGQQKLASEDGTVQLLTWFVPAGASRLASIEANSIETLTIPGDANRLRYEQAALSTSPAGAPVLFSAPTTSYDREVARAKGIPPVVTGRVIRTLRDDGASSGGGKAVAIPDWDKIADIYQLPPNNRVGTMYETTSALVLDGAEAYFVSGRSATRAIDFSVFNEPEQELTIYRTPVAGGAATAVGRSVLLGAEQFASTVLLREFGGRLAALFLMDVGFSSEEYLLYGTAPTPKASRGERARR